MSAISIIEQVSNSRAALIAQDDARRADELMQFVAQHTDSLNLQLYLARSFKGSDVLKGLAANPLLHTEVLGELGDVTLYRRRQLGEREVRKVIKRSIAESAWISRAFGPLTRHNYLTDQYRLVSLKLLCVDAPTMLDFSVGYSGWDVLFSTLGSWHGELFELPRVVTTLI